MTNDTRIPRYDLIVKKARSISQKKNHDYTQATNDPFGNFRQCNHLGICSVEAGIMVRMSDKMSRISTLLTNDAQVNDESVLDTLLDLINYSIILTSYLMHERNLPMIVDPKKDSNV